MKKGFLVMMVTIFLVIAMAFTMHDCMAAKLSQDPEALAFLGSYEGTILAKGSQRSWQITLASVDDNGKVTISRYHYGSVGKYHAEDVPGVTGVFKRQAHKVCVIVTVPRRAEITLTREAGGLRADVIISSGGRDTVHLRKIN